ncbi:MAG: SPOR domain-containing protein [Bacteroidia bacterium]
MRNLLLLFCIFPLILMSCGKKSYDATKRGKIVAKGDYQKYENEVVGTYRKSFSFRLPDVNYPEDTIVFINRSKNVERYFENKKYLYIEASSNLFKMLEKRIVDLPKEEKNEVESTVVSKPNTIIYTPTPKKAPSVVRVPMEIKGFRVQIYTGLQRTEAQEMQKRFSAAFPTVGRYMMYIEPNFRIRVGDFATKADADDFCRTLKRIPDFSGAFVIRDIVKNPLIEEMKNNPDYVPSTGN